MTKTENNSPPPDQRKPDDLPFAQRLLSADEKADVVKQICDGLDADDVRRNRKAVDLAAGRAEAVKMLERFQADHPGEPITFPLVSGKRKFWSIERALAYLDEKGLSISQDGAHESELDWAELCGKPMPVAKRPPNPDEKPIGFGFFDRIDQEAGKLILGHGATASASPETVAAPPPETVAAADPAPDCVSSEDEFRQYAAATCPTHEKAYREFAEPKGLTRDWVRKMIKTLPPEHRRQRGNGKPRTA